MISFFKSAQGRLVMGAVVLIAVIGLVVVACGGSAPNATSVLKSDGYSPMNIGTTNTAPAEISSEAFGTQGPIPNGNGEIVIVLTSQGLQRAPQVENEFNALGSGLSISVSGNVMRVQGPDTAFEALGG